MPSPERQLLMRFFAACQVYDTVVMARLGTAACNPRTDGVVETFEIVEQADDALTLAARVRALGGSAEDQLLRVQLEERDGVRLVREITRLPASRTSPAASSAPPN